MLIKADDRKVTTIPQGSSAHVGLTHDKLTAAPIVTVSLRPLILKSFKFKCFKIVSPPGALGNHLHSLQAATHQVL